MASPAAASTAMTSCSRPPRWRRPASTLASPPPSITTQRVVGFRTTSRVVHRCGEGLGMNETLFEQANALARATPWLHPVIIAYAAYGVAMFAVLLVAGWWTARRSGEPERM